MTKKIGFIGAGNMANSIVGGLIDDGYPPSAIWVSNRGEQKRDNFALRFSINAATSNEALVSEVDVLVLCVKPQGMRALCEEIRPMVEKRKPLVISLAVGLTTETLNEWLGGKVGVVRAMPNTPSLLRAGATGLFASSQVSPREKTLAESLMRAVGMTIWVDDESKIDVIAALSGSGPAYVFFLMQAMQEAAEKLGLDKKAAQALTVQTVFGAAKLALESGDPPEILRQRVTSPKGTTERAIQSFSEDGLLGMVEKAMRAACDRACELSAELSKR